MNLLNAGVLATNVLLKAMLIPHLGLVGAAVSSAIAILGLAAAWLLEEDTLYRIAHRSCRRLATAISLARIGAIGVQDSPQAAGSLRTLAGDGVVAAGLLTINVLVLAFLCLEAEDQMVARLVPFRTARPGIKAGDRHGH